jgi:hypothetical protein
MSKNHFSGCPKIQIRIQLDLGPSSRWIQILSSRADAISLVSSELKSPDRSCHGILQRAGSEVSHDQSAEQTPGPVDGQDAKGIVA